MIKFFRKNKFLSVFLVLIICFSLAYYQLVSLSVSKYNGYTIVVDAGHGGRDGGSVGVGGTIEKNINLKYALCLKDKLVKYGYRVVLTRKNDDGLYDVTDKNKKLSDMNKRFKIIQKANPNLVISIHMNSFNTSTAKGAMTYYRKGDDASKYCADLIQKSFQTYCGARVSTSKVGDFYMLNCSYYTAVLIECGFLSNAEEERLLNHPEYQNKIVDSIVKGVLLYFGNRGM